jgi:hypothetical protein
MFSWIQYWWIIPSIIIYFGYAYFTKLNNSQNENEWKWTIVLFIYGSVFCNLWAFVSKYSKNLIVDGFIYDTIILLAYLITLIYFGYADKFSTYQWIGMSLIIFGFLMMKIN